MPIHPGATQENRNTRYTQRTLAIAIYGVATKSPVWHGAGSKTVSKSETMSQLGSVEPGNIRKGVASILEDFPPE